VERKDTQSFVACADGRKLLLHLPSSNRFTAQIQDGWISRSYGTKLPAKILELRRVFSEHCKVVIDAYCL
jgi:hypothetical protein